MPILNDGNIYGTMNVHFWNTFLQFFTKIFDTKKRPRSVWSRCDEILRVGRRSDMHWTANNRNSSMHKKSALNSLWMRLNPPRKSQPTEDTTPNPETTRRRASRTDAGVTYVTDTQETHSRIRKNPKKAFPFTTHTRTHTYAYWIWVRHGINSPFLKLHHRCFRCVGVAGEPRILPSSRDDLRC